MTCKHSLVVNHLQTTQVIYSANPKVKGKFCSDTCKGHVTWSSHPLPVTYLHSTGLAWHWDLVKGGTLFD